jgi:plastocyanin
MGLTLERSTQEVRTQSWIAVCLSVLLAANAVTGKDKTGTIQGVVSFTGVVPPARQIPTGDGTMIDHFDLVVDAKSKGLRWVIAALEDAPPQPKLDRKEMPVVIDQKDMLFVPRVVAVQHGRPVRFDNSDAFNHSVITAARLQENELNVFVTAREPVTKAFAAEKAPIRIGCALHSSMTAWLYVAPHPWVAVTDEKGAFVLNDIPPGKYTLWLKHPDTGVQERRQIEVQAGQKVEVVVEWKESQAKREPK